MSRIDEEEEEDEEKRLEGCQGEVSSVHTADVNDSSVFLCIEKVGLLTKLKTSQVDL